MYIVGVLVFEYNKLTGKVYLESYLRENPELREGAEEDADVFQEDDVMWETSQIGIVLYPNERS